MTAIDIRPLHASAPVIAALATLIIDVVAGGGSVSFMHPLSREAATAFWDSALAAAGRDERVVLGAWDGNELVGTLTLLLDFPPNQPHRAELAKMMTRPGHRGRGIATALAEQAERIAVSRGRTLLVLDTAADGGAAALYERLGYTAAGRIPDFALKPHGGLTATILYWKRIGATAASAAPNAPNATA